MAMGTAPSGPAAPKGADFPGRRPLKKWAGATGLEPVAFGFGGGEKGVFALSPLGNPAVAAGAGRCWPPAA